MPELPDDVWGNVFRFLTLEERVVCTQISRRWYRLLTCGKFALDNVAVVNLFEMDGKRS